MRMMLAMGQARPGPTCGPPTLGRVLVRGMRGEERRGDKLTR